jgi:hypothetical protein
VNLRWPLPALLAWGTAWALFIGLRAAGAPVLLALLGGTLLGVLGSVWGGSWWRRGLIGLGFPLSLALSGVLSGVLALPAWVWLLPLAVMLLVYPVNAWSDAPLFPTPAKALLELPRFAPLSAGAKVVDAGCGLGWHGQRWWRRARSRLCLRLVRSQARRCWSGGGGRRRRRR